MSTFRWILETSKRFEGLVLILLSFGLATLLHLVLLATDVYAFCYCRFGVFMANRECTGLGQSSNFRDFACDGEKIHVLSLLS